MKGQGISRNRVYEVLGESDAPRRDGEAWKKVHRRYRQLLMEEGWQLRDEEDRMVLKGLTPEEFEAEEARNFEWPAPAVLRHKIRYFVDGLALGSAAFVESVFEKNRVRMGVKRTRGARVPKSPLGGLHTLRDLRDDPLPGALLHQRPYLNQYTALGNENPLVEIVTTPRCSEIALRSPRFRVM